MARIEISAPVITWGRCIIGRGSHYEGELADGMCPYHYDYRADRVANPRSGTRRASEIEKEQARAVLKARKGRRKKGQFGMR
jgi:hypothetical protein